MYNGKYKIAGRVIEINSIYEEVQKMCIDYKSDEKVDFTVTVHDKDIDFERMKSEREDRIEGIPVRQFKDSYLETLAVYRQIAGKMLSYNTMLFHGSAIAVDKEAFLFTAKSGTGKSTHTKLWRKLFGDRAVMVNDDKPLLKVGDDEVFVCVTPWDGKHKISTNTIVPLKAICILERGEVNAIKEISAKEALPMLMQQSYRPADAQEQFQFLNVLDLMASKMKFYRMQCNMDIEAAKMSYNKMSGKE